MPGVVLPPGADVVSVPETAVDRTLYGDSVFVVAEDGKDADGKPEHKAVQTFVETGAAVRRPGRDRARRQPPATSSSRSGQLKLQNGAPVRVSRPTAPGRRPRQPPVRVRRR